jgi:methylglutaconyl-CoA hydratase
LSCGVHDSEIMEEQSPVIYAIEGHVALVTLNRPEKRNALNDALIGGLKSALRDADAREEVRAILITGAGADFCSGADLSALKKISEGTVTENMEDAQSLLELFALIRRVRVPVVAAVRGRALAGGCGLATACDIVLASASARFGYPEVKIGFVPAIVMAILRRNVSEKRAFELVSRGGEVSATEAERIGLVNHVFDDDAFEAKVEKYVADFEHVSSSAVMLTKRLLYQLDGMTFDAALQTGADVNTIARMTDDCQQGIARFLMRLK